MYLLASRYFSISIDMAIRSKDVMTAIIRAETTENIMMELPASRPDRDRTKDGGRIIQYGDEYMYILPSYIPGFEPSGTDAVMFPEKCSSLPSVNWLLLYSRKADMFPDGNIIPLTGSMEGFTMERDFGKESCPASISPKKMLLFGGLLSTPMEQESLSYENELATMRNKI